MAAHHCHSTSSNQSRKTKSFFLAIFPSPSTNTSIESKHAIAPSRHQHLQLIVTPTSSSPSTQEHKLFEFTSHHQLRLRLQQQQGYYCPWSSPNLDIYPTESEASSSHTSREIRGQKLVVFIFGMQPKEFLVAAEEVSSSKKLKGQPCPKSKLGPEEVNRLPNQINVLGPVSPTTHLF